MSITFTLLLRKLALEEVLARMEEIPGGTVSESDRGRTLRLSDDYVIIARYTESDRDEILSEFSTGIASEDPVFIMASRGAFVAQVCPHLFSGADVALVEDGKKATAVEWTSFKPKRGSQDGE